MAVAVEHHVVVGLLLHLFLIVLHDTAGTRFVVIGGEVKEQRPGDIRVVPQ